MVRLFFACILTVAPLFFSGCAAWQGTKRQITSAGEFPSRAIQGTFRYPLSLPTLTELFGRAPGIEFVRAILQGTARQYENAAFGL